MTASDVEIWNVIRLIAAYIYIVWFTHNFIAISQNIAGSSSSSHTLFFIFFVSYSFHFNGPRTSVCYVNRHHNSHLSSQFLSFQAIFHRSKYNTPFLVLCSQIRFFFNTKIMPLMMRLLFRFSQKIKRNQFVVGWRCKVSMCVCARLPFWFGTDGML